jgi:hypothetical protein
METANLVLYLAMVLVFVVVLLAIPRMMVADGESLAALHRQLIIHRHLHAHARVRSIHSQRPDQHQHAAPPMKHAA